MAVCDRQNLIIQILEKVLGFKAEINPSFSWLKNKHLEEDFLNHFNDIEEIFKALKGDEKGMAKKGTRQLKPDCYFGGDYNFIFEFDELQHFTPFKKTVLELYPASIQYGFDIDKYISYCERYGNEALRKGPTGYRKPKPEFPFENGRAAQRAFFDAFRDILPTFYGLKPTVRLSEFEVKNIVSYDNNAIVIIKDILNKRGIVKINSQEHIFE